MTMPALPAGPAPTRIQRHDGITPERQEEFLEVLAATGSISDAAAAIGKSRTALYKLRGSPAGAEFSKRWAEALRQATQAMTDEAFERVFKGQAEPVWYKGEQVGQRIRHDNRLLMFLLRAHDPETYGTASARPAPRAEEPRPAAASPRRAIADCGTRTSPVLAQTLSTSSADIEEDMDDETFRAELRKLRGSPEIPRPLSKRAARRLAARGRLPAMRTP